MSASNRDIMPVIGHVLTAIEAKRTKAPEGVQISINSVPKLIDMKEVDLPGSKKTINVSYEFATTYSPGVGELKISGDLLYSCEDPAKVVKNFKDKKPLEFKELEILNFLFKFCLAKFVRLADELQLPYPMEFPQIKEEQPAEAKK